ncbi:lysosomal membrane ascorbate-dependent ferrireductase CYB561A3 [Latimeria chalumnae]|uniref:Lysosomal membrane ascorbate-dependent ferrireductase CYB561A3 n=1 Tax=Latimeria chalumnae TaxID=7897 RepID=H3BDI9_LATCH|nr:PREDICTED: cytochrome b ascorbate-dependent protein 3 [Latimeria chalumnae]XP_005988044.1 PREDICTED: cytochrome b ascorbate-dependent protein 3 [Latimeria chalumnae]XP_005988045.1 PREDICTED: cytochrome b ascorbate-dependent protein 3 [Latimeria chalumnae]|eukprot:XP_005988043.1 PREDICTED: cytochrome b ascorbate-dependent protein 3 [Latimeria chalumnae]
MKLSSQFYLTYLLSLLIGVLCVVFVSYWSSTWRGGFAWDGSGKMFNWHPVCMVTGLIVLYGNAILVYRFPFSWPGSKLLWKVVHAGMTLAAFSLAVVGLVAVFTFHNKQKIPNLYSLHSWVGISTVILFACQWLMGFLSFLLPCTPAWFRQLYKHLHVFSGTAIFIMAIVSAVAGINEKLLFNLNTPNTTTPYSHFPPEALFANFLGILIIAFGLVVLWLLSREAWQRPDSTSSDVIQPLLQNEN